MIVSVRLHANLRRQTPRGLIDRLEVELGDRATVADLLRELQLDTTPEATMLLVNRRYAKPDQPLQPGDDIRLFPPISGGQDAPG